MADFIPALEVMIRNEGGYKLIKRREEFGGSSFAGITSKVLPNWRGWELIEKDPHHPTLISLVKSYYFEQFWQMVGGDEIRSQRVASSLFDFAVTNGVEKAVKVAQMVVGTRLDGEMGEKTLKQLNAMDEELFVLRYSMGKVQRFTEEHIFAKDPSRALSRMKSSHCAGRGMASKLVAAMS